MLLLRQLLHLARVQLTLWRRRPIEAGICLGLSVVFLVVANQVYTIWLGPHVRIGLMVERESLQATMTIELEALGVSVEPYASSMQGREAMQRGDIVCLVAVEEGTPTRLSLYLAGRNLILDQELSSRLLQAIARAVEAESPSLRLEVYPPSRTPEAITTFMTASLLSFLILTLAHTNSGSFWVRDWEQMHLNTFLMTPAHRLALVVGRISAGMVLTAGLVGMAIAICRWFVFWSLPDQWLPWVGVMTLQIFMANSFFFAIASACRRYRFYVNVSSFLVIVLMFVSGSVTPVEVMAPWERTLALFTPTFYAVRSMRAVMLGLDPVRFVDMIAMVGWGIACCAIGYHQLGRGLWPATRSAAKERTTS